MPLIKKGAKCVKVKTRDVVERHCTNYMLNEQLKEEIIQLREELDRERKERNYIQIERDKVYALWEITKTELEEMKADMKFRDRELEKAEESHQAEIKVYKQKVKHLLDEKQDLETNVVVATKALEKKQADVEKELRREMQRLKKDLKEQELLYENIIKNSKLSHDKEMTRLRTKFEGKVEEIKATYEEKMEKQQQEQDLRCNTEIHEIQQRKSIHINMQAENQEKAPMSNEITSHKEKAPDMKKKEERLEKEMAKVLQVNKRLKESLQEAKQEVSGLQKQLTKNKKVKDLLVEAKAQLKVADREVKDLKWECKVLKQRFSRVQQERDELYKNFSKAILGVQQKSSFKTLLLETKMKTLADTVEKKDTELNEVPAASNLNSSTLNLEWNLGMEETPEAVSLNAQQHPGQ